MTVRNDRDRLQNLPPMWAQPPPERSAGSIGARLLGSYRDGGLPSVLMYGRRYIGFHRSRLWLAVLARLQYLLPLKRTFRLTGKTYRYFFHPHNTTWRNERCVEIALAIDVLKAGSGKRVLEVGNVLAYYMPVCHEVLDKYERGRGITNVDIVEFCPSTSYDLILSISTMEHVGWDETELEPDKARAAFAHLTAMLAPGGRLWVTIPRGYHRYLDRDVDQGVIPFTELLFLRRTSLRNWHQVTHEDVRGIPYGVGFQGAIALTIGILEKPLAPSAGPRRSARELSTGK